LLYKPIENFFLFFCFYFLGAGAMGGRRKDARDGDMILGGEQYPVASGNEGKK
jgi:hypothetical protein